MTLLPRTLFGRVALILGVALALAHGLTLLIIVKERGDLGLSLMTSYLGRDVAASVAILERVPAAERAAWLPALARQNYRYRLGAPPAQAVPSAHPLAAPLKASVDERLSAQRSGPLSESRLDNEVLMHLPLRLSDGSPLTLELQPPRPGVSVLSLTLLLLQLLALGGAGWVAVRLAVKPVSQLARAAEGIRNGAESSAPMLISGSRHDPLQGFTQGPVEVRQALRAFQAMQGRIEGQLTERLQLLAAISHDLQTPITRMRLRAEQIDAQPLRDKVLADLQAMQHLVDEGLTYARTAHAGTEPLRLVDLPALLDGLVCDAVDAGGDAVLIEPLGLSSPTLNTRVLALSRLLTNLIDNALAFGQRAELRVSEAAGRVVISVLDAGPGIPPGDLERVFEPFHRLEGSRNRATGGSGLGLAIARQLALAVQAELSLHNRPEGGLEARLSLPRQA